MLHAKSIALFSLLILEGKKGRAQSFAWIFSWFIP